MSRRGGLDSVRFSRLLPNPQDNSLCSAITVYYILFYYLPFHSIGVWPEEDTEEEEEEVVLATEQELIGDGVLLS